MATSEQIAESEARIKDEQHLLLVQAVKTMGMLGDALRLIRAEQIKQAGQIKDLASALDAVLWKLGERDAGDGQ